MGIFLSPPGGQFRFYGNSIHGIDMSVEDLLTLEAKGEPAEIGPRNAREAIQALWGVCDDGWLASAAADQIWKIRASCPHGDFKAQGSWFELDALLVEIADQARAAHKSEQIG